MRTPRPFHAVTATVMFSIGALSIGGAAAQTAGPVSSHDGVIVITEIMYNPTEVYDSRGEWFEIHNTSGDPVALDGWTIGDDTYDTHTISSLSVAPGARAVLARFGDPDRNGGVAVDYVYGDAVVLFNLRDRVTVRNATGALVDDVAYGDAGFPVADGQSLSLVDGAADNAAGASWCLATTTLPGGDLGSPGASTQCGASAASLVVSEIMINPTGVDDATGEWFELTNTGDETVDIAGFTVQDEDGESFVVGGSPQVEPGGRVVLATSADASTNGGVAVDVDYGDTMRLNNTFDELIVNDVAGIQVDAVRWDDGATFPDPAGASIELADLTADNGVGANWCVATLPWAASDLGSPGHESDCAPMPVPSVVITEIMFDPSTTPERDGEWFELSNIGESEAVLDGYVARTRTGEYRIESLTIDAGEVAVLASSGNPSTNGGVTAHGEYGEALALYNTNGLIELASPAGVVVDRVAYSVGAGFPMVESHSIEVRSPDVDNALGANWCSSFDSYGVGDFGTPGTTGVCPELEPTAPLVVSEVMRNPAASLDAYGEWVEIYNPTADPVDLHRWRLGDHGSEGFRFATSLVVPPDGFVVVGRSADLDRNGGVEVDLAVGVRMVLIDSTDEVVLSDPAGRIIDEVMWGRDSALPRPNGASIQRSMTSLRALADNGDVSEWCTTDRQFGAGDRGTPGLANDCAPNAEGAVVINEVHRDPKAEPDAQAEWIELHNVGDAAVDLSGWHLLDDDADAWTFPMGVTVEAGGYLTLGRNGPDINGGIGLDVLYGPEIILFNTDDEISLLDADRAVVDRVAWTAVNGFPKVAGASMALRDPTLDNSVGGSWCASVTDQGNGDLGTPDAENLCELPEQEPDPEPDPEPEPHEYSLFSTASGDCPSEIKINASELRVGTAVRANGDLSVDGSSMVFDAPISHGGEIRLGHGAVTTSVVHEATAQAAPTDWMLERFMPGGDLASGEHYAFHEGDLRVQGNGADLPAGIHAVAGDVHITSGTALLNGVTIVAAGEIKISSSQVALAPYASDLPALYSARTSCRDDSISISTSNLTVVGSVYVPDSGLKIAASIVKLDGGSFVGASVRINGSRVALNAPAT